MSVKNRIGFYVFTLGVLMLLLRPYLVYQLTAARDMDPARAFGLLQRLVKKKDDHHEEQTATGYAILNSKIAVTPGRVPLISLAFFLLSLFHPLIRLVETVPVFIPSQRHRYRLTSCLLI